MNCYKLTHSTHLVLVSSSTTVVWFACYLRLFVYLSEMKRLTAGTGVNLKTVQLKHNTWRVNLAAFTQGETENITFVFAIYLIILLFYCQLKVLQYLNSKRVLQIFINCCDNMSDGIRRLRTHTHTHTHMHTHLQVHSRAHTESMHRWAENTWTCIVGHRSVIG